LRIKDHDGPFSPRKRLFHYTLYAGVQRHLYVPSVLGRLETEHPYHPASVVHLNGNAAVRRPQVIIVFLLQTGITHGISFRISVFLQLGKTPIIYIVKIPENMGRQFASGIRTDRARLHHHSGHLGLKLFHGDSLLESYVAANRDRDKRRDNSFIETGTQFFHGNMQNRRYSTQHILQLRVLLRQDHYIVGKDVTGEHRPVTVQDGTARPRLRDKLYAILPAKLDESTPPKKLHSGKEE